MEFTAPILSRRLGGHPSDGVSPVDAASGFAVINTATRKDPDQQQHRHQDR
jgi:hypothetical protein